MENVINLVQILLDAALLFFCCERIFLEKSNRKVKDFLLLAVITLLWMAARVNIIVGNQSSVFFTAHGFEIAPANNLWLLIYLVLAVLVTNSIYYNPPSNEFAFCGTMAAFSIYFLTRLVSVVLFVLCGVSGNLLLFGSRILSFLIAVFLLNHSASDWMRRTIQNGGYLIGLASANVAAVLIVILRLLQFDIDRLIDNIWIVITLILLLLFLDSCMLYYHQRKIQEQKRIHMIEQYVPIVEEMISQVRARQHEFNNRIFSINAAVNTARTLEEAKEAVAALTKGVVLHPNDRELLACDSKIIAGMLYGKMKQAQFVGITVNMELHGLFKKSATPETEWIEIIGILLDNALEASLNGDVVYLKSKQNGDYLELTISNPADPMSNSEFMRLFQKGVTSKQDNQAHGFGLYNILRMTERYRGKILTRNQQIDNKNYVVFGVLLP